MDQLPPPIVFNLPKKFNKWRPHQAEAMESQTEDKPRFLLQVCPTGFGKSVVYLTASQLISGRTIILTSTKGLQSQLMSDFGSIKGVVDIRGRQNYPCRLNTKLNCDSGLCVFGMKCSFREEGGCFYFDQLHRAKHAKVVITNYAYWMSQNEYSEGLGKFDLLVLDEAHSSPDHVIDHIGVSFSKKSQTNRILDLNDSLPNDHATWQSWASSRLVDAKMEAESAKSNRKEKLYLQLKRLVEKLTRLTAIDRSWVWEDNPYSVTLSPTWPAPFAEIILFLGIPKVVFTSATVVPKTAALLGVPPKEMKVEEYEQTFPVKNRLLIHIPTIRMNYKITEAGNKLWINKVDQIIRNRLGRKGIIHTISYARRDMIINQSRFAEYMITHERKNTESIVRTFKRSNAPCILVSPTMTTGWDFPLDEMRWQIIVKVPFPDLRGEIMKARSRQDKDFVNYIIAQQLVQTVGRGVRSQDDWCESYIIDDTIIWWVSQNKHLVPNWFKGSYISKKLIPPPLGK